MNINEQEAIVSRIAGVDQTLAISEYHLELDALLQDITGDDQVVIRSMVAQKMSEWPKLNPGIANPYARPTSGYFYPAGGS